MAGIRLHEKLLRKQAFAGVDSRTAGRHAWDDGDVHMNGDNPRHETRDTGRVDLGGSGDFEIVRVTTESNWLDELRQELSTASAGKQIAIGGLSGWFSGYIVGKVGKAAALALGGSLIILQVANYQGLIQINWNRVQHSVESTKRRIQQHTADNMSVMIDTIKDVARQHIYLAGSFGAGFLLGLVT